MARSYSVIEINGSRYDAVNGQLLGTVTKISNRMKNAQSGVIDGFTRRNARQAATVLTPLPKTAQKEKKTDAKANRSLQSPAQNMHKRTQKSLTLMRGAVKRPGKDKAEPVLHTNHARTASEHKRAARAQNVVKHNKIRHFGTPAHSIEANLSTPSSSAANVSSPMIEAAATRAVTKVSETRSLPSPIGNLSGRQLERMLDQALMRADAHKSSFKRSSKLGRLTSMPRWASVGASVLIFIILGSFFAWQNVPQVSMRLAALRADIPASVPGYTPSGFSFSGPISYSDGAVSVRFKANSDGFRSFTILQEKSALNSQSLAASSVPSGTQVQTSQVKGTTVYIYGPSNDATWVDKGIKYTLQDGANLTSDQILKIAGSL